MMWFLEHLLAQINAVNIILPAQDHKCIVYLWCPIYKKTPETCGVTLYMGVWSRTAGVCLGTPVSLLTCTLTQWLGDNEPLEGVLIDSVSQTCRSLTPSHRAARQCSPLGSKGRSNRAGGCVEKLGAGSGFRGSLRPDSMKIFPGFSGVDI